MLRGCGFKEDGMAGTTNGGAYGAHVENIKLNEQNASEARHRAGHGDPFAVMT